MTAVSRRAQEGIAVSVLAAVGFWAYHRSQRRRRHSFAGQVVLITGSSRGLGLELARVWAEEGAAIVLCARTATDLEIAARELLGAGRDVLAFACDVTEREECERLVQQVIAAWGRIDVLVNNAGIIQTGPIESMTLDDFQETMNTHFWGPLYLIQACLPHMRAQGSGKIVNVASIGGEISVPHLVPYSASKFALVGLSEGLACELSAANIDVTTVCPGLMRTGSPRNAEFKGQHRAEYAWFSISDSLPVVSLASRSAARQIVAACRRGDRYLRLSVPAKIGVPLRAIFPDLTSRLLSLCNRLLPRAAGADSRGKRGYESFSWWSPSVLTALTEQAAARNNQLAHRQGEKA